MVYNGTAVLTRLDGTTIALLREASLEISQELPDATTKDSLAWAENINGLRSWSVSVSGLCDFSNNANADTLTDMIFNRADASLQFFPQTNTNIYFYGNVDLESCSISAPMEDVCTLEGSLKGNGTLTKGAVANSNA